MLYRLKDLLKTYNIFFILSWMILILLSPIGAGAETQTVSTRQGIFQLILKPDSRTMLLNGEELQAVQPVTLHNGLNYAPLSSLAQAFDFELAYDARTKEAVALRGDQELRFRVNSSTVMVNGNQVHASGVLFVQDGSLMVPLRTWANVTDSFFTVQGTAFVFTWNTAPTANFRVSPDVIYATQTVVTYEDEATTFAGRQIVDEIWEGKRDVFERPGTYVITRRVMDEAGVWSEPYQVTIYVREPNQPPVADFQTDKKKYRIGEPIEYTDLSVDDEDLIVRRTWEGKEPAFFEEGEYEITLEVEDHLGLVDSVTKTITVTNKTLYKPEEFYYLFTEVGNKFPIDGSSVLNIPSLPYRIYSDNTPFIRSNSPERLTGQEGILYRDTMFGDFRLLIHNQNTSTKDYHLYVIVTNPLDVDATVDVKAFGMAGPAQYVTDSGKTSVSRYLSSLRDRRMIDRVTVPAGESMILLPEMQKNALRPDLTMTVYADLYASNALEFSIVALEASKNVLASLPELEVVQRDEYHVRGTFYGANRSFQIDDRLLGEEKSRIVIGDRQIDAPITGIDQMTGLPETNSGNRGALYMMQLSVAPNTLIALNGRGGHYAGAFLVNGEVVPVTETSMIKDPNEAAVLYRTGSEAEMVEILFVLASGSNLPLNVLLLPLPEEKE